MTQTPSAPASALLRATLPPSRFRLPQQCSFDRRRARFAALEQQRTLYEFVDDDLPGHPTGGFRLPRYVKSLPPAAKFTAPKMVNFLQAKLQAQVNQYVGMFTARKPPFQDPLQYRNLIKSLPYPPTAVKGWQDGHQFSAQHLVGVDPLELRVCTEVPDNELAQAADAVLKQAGTTLKDAMTAGRLFIVDYPVIGDERVQLDATERSLKVLVPTCLFWADPKSEFKGVAIRLRQVSPAFSKVFTPLDGNARWSYARFHAQVANGAYHEGVRHLLETHLVSEVVAVCTQRQLHQDHPLHQMLMPHFRFTLAINTLARGDLLAPEGPIDRALSLGVSGALDAARVVWQTWDFTQTMPHAELGSRGFGTGPGLLEGQYWYPGDVMNLWNAILKYVRGVLELWYVIPADLVEDTELQAWAAEIAGERSGGIRGFPAQFDSLDRLCECVAAIILRASVLHAAVNNGQYETYGFVPNSPGFYQGPALEQTGADAALQELAVWAGLPDFNRSVNQFSMAWVLSSPTTHDLFSAGESEAFSEALNPAARDVVADFRRTLRNLSEAIQKRNAGLKNPYPYLDPAGIACSVET